MRLFSFQFNSNHDEPSNRLNHSLESEDSTLSSSGSTTIINACRCCGALVKIPECVMKYKCSICKSTIVLVHKPQEPCSSSITYELINNEIKNCENNARTRIDKMSIHSVYKPLEELIVSTFGAFGVLNNSFIDLKKSGSLKSIDLKAVKDTYDRIISLPTRRPYLNLLFAVNDLLRRPSHSISSPDDLRWLFILFELPTLPECIYHKRRVSAENLKKLDTPEIKSVSYEIFKRVVGYLANSDSKCLEQIIKAFYSLSIDKFSYKVQLLNLYITFHLTKLINNKLNDSPKKSLDNSGGPTFQDHANTSNLGPKITSPILNSTEPTSQSNSGSYFPLQISFQTWKERTHTRYTSSYEQNPTDFKLRVSHYGPEWHIKSAAILLSALYMANKGRLPYYSFYNSLTDFIHLKQDFEIWQNGIKKNESYLSSSITDSMTLGHFSGISQFTFCHYPFLLTLGSKISILEHEARRSMERKAEEAFITALDRREALDVNLKLQVRRDYIATDTLRCIKMYSEKDLKKALKIEFIGEPGIDGGGLKKEWFSLLTKELFNEENGMFIYDKESHFCWFSPNSTEPNNELYYITGVILGLAIYNSIILDLKFPPALYKKLVGKKIRFEDYLELFPSTGRGLQKLLEYSGNVEDLELFYEASYKDLINGIVIEELIPDGSTIKVTNQNRKDYVEKWYSFFMNSSIESQFQSFHKGFHNVIGGNALSLFSAKEIEMIICGNDEPQIDTALFRSITKYSGWENEEYANNSEIVQWFWNWFNEISNSQQKKFLSFVTGSDRIPATGISTMSFKITRIKSYDSIKKLPIAHTCFNELCLYDYDNENEMVEKLTTSIYESEGFGLK
ncbi:hypothetical protein WICMUC_001533 [Wickerhamomyces mucosus]|uniref:HECT-type E3 ubiquitin transferase n=1 Tax=Wickerhamomyces mucosus TaxID=1378264 RepID=A0A9P8THG0_9ASCO|nr:hypothetical protein WICMUC_001533 [Wickerhamomyces mucosus]